MSGTKTWMKKTFCCGTFSTTKALALIELFWLDFSACKMDSFENDGLAFSKGASFVFQVRVAIEVQTLSFEALDR